MPTPILCPIPGINARDTTGEVHLCICVRRGGRVGRKQGKRNDGELGNILSYNWFFCVPFFLARSVRNKYRCMCYYNIFCAPIKSRIGYFFCEKTYFRKFFNNANYNFKFRSRLILSNKR